MYLQLNRINKFLCEAIVYIPPVSTHIFYKPISAFAGMGENIYFIFLLLLKPHHYWLFVKEIA